MRDDLPDRPVDPLVLAFLPYFGVVVGFVLVGSQLQLWNLPLGLIASSLFVFGAPALVLAALLNLRPLAFTGLMRTPALLVGAGLLLALVNLPLANWLMGVATELFPEELVEAAKLMERILALADPTSRALLVVAAAVAAPLGEELFFRGWMQPMAERRLPRGVAIALVAFAFSATHLDPVGFVARFELGVLFGLLRAWTGSLWPAIAMHAAHNGVSILAGIYLVDNPMEELTRDFSALEAAPIALISLIATAALLRALRRRAVTPALVPLAELAREPSRPALSLTPLAGLTWLTALGLPALAVAVLLSTYGRALPGGTLLDALQAPLPVPAVPKLE